MISIVININEHDGQLYFELSITIVIVGVTIILNNNSSTDVCFPFFDKNLSNFKRKDNFIMSLKVRDLECDKMGPRQSWADIFLFFKLAITTISLRCLFSNSKILLKCWTEPSLKDLMWNIKYFLDIKKWPRFCTHFTNNSRWFMALSNKQKWQTI